MNIFVPKFKNSFFIIFIFSCIIFLISTKSISEENKNLLWQTSAGNNYSKDFFL